MNNLRESLRKLLYSNPITSALLPAGIVFVFLYPALFMVNNAIWSSFISGVLPILYVFYLLGIIICIATYRDWAVAAAFYIKAFGYLLSLFNSFIPGTFLWMLVYILLGTVSIWIMMATKQGNDMLAMSFHRPQSTYRPGPDAMEGEPQAAPQHCPCCGNLVEPGAMFCSFCGNKYPQEVLNAMGGGMGGYRGPIHQIGELCGSTLALVFNIALTANILFTLIANFSLGQIVSQSLMILICVSCWIIYAGSRNHNLTTTGFSIMNVVMIIETVLALIVPVIGVIVGGILIATGYSDAASVGIAIILGCVIGGVLLFLYWNGFRKTSASAKQILLGQQVPWTASMYCIVFTSISVFINTVSVIAKMVLAASFESFAYSLKNEFSYYLGGGSFADSIIDGLTDAVIGGNPVLATISAIVGITVGVCAVLILLKVREGGNESR